MQKDSLSKWFDTNRDKLRKAKRGIIIWLVSIIVVLLVAAIVSYIMNEQQVAGQRIFQLERQLEAAIEEKTVLESKLAQMPRLRERLTSLFGEKQVQAAIEKKRTVEKRLKDTISQLEKTVGQLEGMGQLEKTAQQLNGMDQLREQFVNSLEEITRLKKDLAEQLEAQRSINELLGSWKPEGERPETKKAEELVPVKAAEEARKVTHALDEEKPKRPLSYRKIQSEPGFFEKSTLAIVFVIAFVVGVTFLCLFGPRFQLLRKSIKRAISLVVKKQVPEEELHKFERLEDISSTLLGGLLLKGFVKMGYEVTLSSGITSGRLMCVLERENEKALFRYIICKENDFGQTFVKDFAKSMKEEKADKGYLVTTGAVTEPVLALAKEKSIELAGKEKLVELIPSCLLQEGLMKKLDDTQAELTKQAVILEDGLSQKEALSKKLKENQNMITKLNDEKIALSEDAKTKEAEYSSLLKKHENIEKELQNQKEEISSLVSERDNLREEISQLQEKAQDLDEQSAKYKELEEQLSERDKLLEEERSQRQQLEEKLRQIDKDMEEAMYLADDSEEKLAKKAQELSEKETALKKLSDQGKLKEAVSGELEELKTNNQILQQSLAEKERLIDSFNKLQKDLETELSAKTELFTELEHQLSLAEQEVQKEDVTAITELQEQLVKEKKEALKEISERIGVLNDELKVKDELISKLREENQQLSAKKDASAKRSVTKLQNEVRSYFAEMEDAVFPSLDLRPLADKGVLLKLEPKGPVVTLKNITAGGVSFESQRKLDVPSRCNITLIFFGSSNPLTVRGSLIWQKKLPGTSVYNIRFKFLSLKQSQSRRINEYINNARKTLNKVKK